ncbi:CBS domain-containing protein [Natronomonas gomsonensis]|uniref:CBS domain-containing protein n=1 Tax=Natronomonas gomsonensis TaxID=1046043 RepID=UPI0020CA2B0E|nr:CBS domain-containing protein [Natronomonas gomsonensis]MCY4731383.1 CBS domain-containing protein [Natronomonas gomsonensis]
MLVSLTVEDVMSAPVETVSPEATGAAAARALRDADIGSLVVCEDGRPVGIITESDMVALLAENADAESLTVRELIPGELITIEKDAEIEAAATLLADHDIHRLPVCEAGELVGIVTTTDLSYYLPHLSRRTSNWTERIKRPHSTSPSTAYDAPDWTFERVGEGALSVGDAVRFRKGLSEADVRGFAEATGDTNRIHLDDDFAEQTRFGGRIAHGILTAGLISAALARLPGLTIYLSQDLRFLGPVEVGETITAVCEVVEDLGKEKFELTTTVYDGDGEVVVDGKAIVLVTELPREAETQTAQLQ